MSFELQSASAGELLYIFLLCLGLLISLTIAFSSIAKFGLSAVAIRPIVPFVLFFSLIHFFTPLIKLTEGVYRYQGDYSSETQVFVASLSLLLLLFGVLLSSSRQFSASPRSRLAAPSSARGAQRYTFVAMVLYFVGGFFALQDAHVIFNKIGYIRFLSDTHAAAEMRSPLRIFSNLMILGAALVLSSLLSKKKKGRVEFIKIGLVAAPVITYALVLNSRNTIFIVFLTLLTVYLGFVFDFRDSNRRTKRIRTIKRSTIYQLVVLTFILSLLFLAFTSMSKQRYSQGDSDYVFERRERLLVYSIDGAFGNDENLLWLVENNDYNLFYGRTYVAGLLVIIPRRIWPDKPHGAGPDLINLIRPGSYVEGAAGNNSLTTGLLTESLMNFGFLGMFGGVIVWAFLSSRFIRAFHRSVNLFYRTAFLISALLVSTTFLYQEFLGFFGRSFIVVAPLFILGFFVGAPKTARIQ